MLNLSRTIHTIDAHTGGEPLRILMAGLPPVPGTTILEKRAWLRANRDDLRQFLMNEPRGHADMYGAYLLPPTTPGADCPKLSDAPRKIASHADQRIARTGNIPAALLRSLPCALIRVQSPFPLWNFTKTSRHDR